MTKTDARKITVTFVETQKHVDLQLLAIAIAEQIKMEEGKSNDNDRRKQVQRIIYGNRRTANVDQYHMENNLRLIRESCLLRQADVCEIMRKFDKAFDQSMLSKMENGSCLPTPIQLAKLADIYGCDPADLINAELLY